MALFDTSGGLGGLLGDLGIGVPRNTGLIGNEDIDAINRRALMSGGVNALLTYLATPKNLGAGSALPYLGRAALSGFGASQNTIDQALNTAYRNRILAGREDNLYNVDGALVNREGKVVYQAPAKEKEVKTQLIDVGNKKILIDEASGTPIKEFSVAKQPKDVNYTVQTDASGQAVYVPNVPGLPVLDQTGKAVSYKPAPTAAEAKVQEKQAQAKKLPTLINEAEGLLKEATGSYLGAARDIAAATIGKSTKGAQNIASLKGIEANLILSMPRLEGPQSNLDQQLYRQAAGQIGDPTVPNETKMAALQTIKRINTQYGEDGMQNKSAQQTNVQAPTSTFKEGAKTKSKSGKPMVFRNGQWEYE